MRSFLPAKVMYLFSISIYLIFYLITITLALSRKSSSCKNTSVFVNCLNFRIITSVFSNAPYWLVGINTILPVKLVLNASTAYNAVRVSPITTYTRGSRVYFFKYFLCWNAGTCSGIVTLMCSSRIFTLKLEMLRMEGPWSTKPLKMSKLLPQVGQISFSPIKAPVAKFVKSKPQKLPKA